MQKFMQGEGTDAEHIQLVALVSAHSRARALQYIILIGASCVSNTHGHGVLMEQLKVDQYLVQLQQNNRFNACSHPLCSNFNMLSFTKPVKNCIVNK